MPFTGNEHKMRQFRLHELPWPCSASVTPGFTPSSISDRFNQPFKHDSEIAKSSAMSLIRTSDPRLRATRITSSRNSLG